METIFLLRLEKNKENEFFTVFVFVTSMQYGRPPHNTIDLCNTASPSSLYNSGSTRPGMQLMRLAIGQSGTCSVTRHISDSSTCA
jgi:hypothetical protein